MVWWSLGLKLLGSASLTERRVCTLHGRILALKQDPTHLHYKVTWPEQPLTPPSSDREDDTEALLRSYFNLSLDLKSLYEQWSEADSNFRKRAPEFAGVRILNQDAWEALLGFICSSNNNISRISQMVRAFLQRCRANRSYLQVHKLCRYYGPLLGQVGDEAMHDFPTPASLTGSGVESHLRELGFGYRARYIAETARKVANEKPSNWLESLRNPEQPSLGSEHVPAQDHATYKEAHEELLTLSGVGPKVADCVCLMGLGWGESVPVDTHVWQIAQRDYKFGKTKTKTFNKVMYDSVGDHFRSLWGKYAGWAHSVLFTADLREFADRSPKKEVVKVVEIKEEPMSPSQGQWTRKRKVIVDTKIATAIKVEATEKGPVVEMEEAQAKRRRTRASAR